MKESIISVLHEHGAVEMPAAHLCTSKHATNVKLMFVPDLSSVLAATLVENDTRTIQRPIKNLRIKEHKHNMGKGRWTHTTFKVVVYKDGSSSIIDGQHRLRAMRAVESMKEHPRTVIVEIYYVNSEKDAGIIFSNIDTNSSSRSQKDLMVAYGLTKTYNLNPAYMTKLIRASMISDNKCEKTTVDTILAYDVEEMKKNLEKRESFISYIAPVLDKIKEDGGFEDNFKFFFDNAMAIAPMMALEQKHSELFSQMIDVLLHLDDCGKKGNKYINLYTYIKTRRNNDLWATSSRFLRSKVLVSLIWKAALTGKAIPKITSSNLDAKCLDRAAKFHNTDIFVI